MLLLSALWHTFVAVCDIVILWGWLTGRLRWVSKDKKGGRIGGMSDYPCRGQMFQSQRAAAEWIKQQKQVAENAYDLYVYRCDDGHWHGRAA